MISARFKDFLINFSIASVLGILILGLGYFFIVKREESNQETSTFYNYAAIVDGVVIEKGSDYILVEGKDKNKKIKNDDFDLIWRFSNEEGTVETAEFMPFTDINVGDAVSAAQPEKGSGLRLLVVKGKEEQ